MLFRVLVDRDRLFHRGLFHVEIEPEALLKYWPLDVTETIVSVGSV